jgi:hypothetical protein
MQIITSEEKKINTNGQLLLELFEDDLPVRPYCTDTLGNLFIRHKSEAIKKKYIQPNSPWDLKWLVYDVDRPTAHFDWQDIKAPPPNITVTNMNNGHAHLLYGLLVPVYKQPEARQKPLRYAASIDVALTRTLQADPNYAKLICKNPLHNNWLTHEYYPYPYDLNHLADYLDLSPYTDKRKHLPAIGLGRNCTLFDVTRRRAYSMIRRNNFLNMDFFIYEVTQYAAERNIQFEIPLPLREVNATGKSIGKWTWRHMSRQGFLEWGEKRRKKSIEVRRSKAEERNEQIRIFKKENPETTNKEIAAEFKVSLWTVAKLRLSEL